MIEFAINGTNVAVAARTKSELEKTVGEIESHGVLGLAIPTDLSTLEGVEECSKEYFDKFKRINILINNAGMTFGSTVIDTPIE